MRGGDNYSPYVYRDPNTLPPHQQAKARAARLAFLLDKSTIYAKIIGDRMERQQIEKAKAEKRAAVRAENKEKKGDVKPGRHSTRTREKADEPATGKRKRKSDAAAPEKKPKVNDDANAGDKEATETKEPEDTGDSKEDVAQDNQEEEGQYTFAQPALVTGAKLRDYQLAGVQWMISLYENGLNGILADEMGLGKTLQTISFLAHLRSKGTWGPFLIVCPLSVLNNWIMEFEKFCPTIPVRQSLRRLVILS